MNGSSCGTPIQFEFSCDLLFKILETNQDALDILGNEGCQQIWSWMNNKLLPLEAFTEFYPKKYFCCFDDYMPKGM